MVAEGDEEEEDDEGEFAEACDDVEGCCEAFADVEAEAAAAA